MTKISEVLGLSLANAYGMVDQVDPNPDVLMLSHSLLRNPIAHPFRAVRMIRDPRDIWVSGYLYHRHCNEAWCINDDMDPAPPIGWPQVPFSFAHWPEEWKARYLQRLGGRSYRHNLLARSLADGLDFELDGYTGCTLAAMRAWTLSGAHLMNIKLEDVMAEFDATMLRIFRHFGLTSEQCRVALDVAGSEDVNRMEDAVIAERTIIHSRTISKWPAYLSPAQLEHFQAHYSDLIQNLGYDLAPV